MSFIHQKKVKQNLNRILFILLGLHLMISTSLYFLQEKLIFLPTKLEQDFTYQFNYPFEELFLNTDKDAIINALHFKAKKAKGVILYFHGNAGDLNRWGKITEFLVAKDYDVFVMDYRTYGKSTGKLSENALYSDAQYCYDYLLKHYSEENITLYGRSLGTGIASYLASKNQPKQLILETPYYSLLDVAKKRFPVFPLKILMKYELPTFKYIKKVTCPIALLHGTNDKIIPIQSAVKLYDERKNENISLTIIEGAKHNNLNAFETYINKIEEIL
jgi:alpha-beta hydrolase superfamily lysophospholipase